MQTVMAPIVERLTADNPVGQGRRAHRRPADRRPGRASCSGFLSGKVLGQFEFFDRPGGQLLLVAPNMVAVERQLKVDPRDFRLWVCLHEVTHRVQFTAVPWLRQHMLDEVDALSATIDTDPAEMRRRLSGAVGELVKVVRGQGNGAGLMSVLATPEQRAVLDRVTAFMSLVEGHAEYVMNAVSPTVIPSQQTIENRFALRRRRGGNPLDRLLRRLLGMEAKTRQYVDGSAFVRTVVDRIGVDDFNAIWTSPRDAADQGRDRRSRPLDRPRPRLTGPPMGPGTGRRGGRVAVRRAAAGDARTGDASWWPARAAPTRSALAAATAFVRARDRAARRAGHRRPRPAGRVGRTGRAGRRARRASSGWTRSRMRRVDVGTRRRPRGRRPARPATPRWTSSPPSSTPHVLLGHTLDDQAETVLLGLGRGSGPRSIAGMPAVDGRYLRPLLGLRRDHDARRPAPPSDLPVWDDPHNADPAFQRVRLRHEVLPLLEDVLQGGVAEALARTGGPAARRPRRAGRLGRRGAGRARPGDGLPVAALARPAAAPSAPACCGPGPRRGCRAR